jgi:hypothetical protein
MDLAIAKYRDVYASQSQLSRVMAAGSFSHVFKAAYQQTPQVCATQKILKTLRPFSA